MELTLDMNSSMDHMDFFMVNDLSSNLGFC